MTSIQIDEPIRVYGACPHDCPDTCGFVTEVVDGRAVNFYGDPDNTVTDGWLCAKVRPYLDHVYHPERLTTPLRRTSPKNAPAEWKPISWEEAIREITDKWKAIIAEHGAEAILPYSFSGTLGLLQMSVASGRFWNRLGASQLERSICGEAGGTAIRKTLGRRRSNPYPHVADTELIIIWGHNPVSTAPHFMPHLTQARKNGTKVVVIDPRRTRTARGADWHIQPNPASDGAIALAMAHLIFEENQHDEAWLDANTIGWRDYREHVKQYTPEWAAEIAGISPDDIRKLTQMYTSTRPSLIKTADGIQRHQNGGQTVRAMLALPALTGQYGVRGGGMSYSTGGYFPWNSDSIHKWSESPAPGRWVNMNRLGAALTGEVQDPPIQSLFVFGANPVAASPNAGLIVEGLQREDLFTVVHELFMTDTADYADIVLPATSQLEQLDLHRAYGHTQLVLNDPAIPPLGESKSNWDVLRLLAEGMGFTESWLHDDAETVLDEVLTSSAATTMPELGDITIEKLRQNQGAWQVPFEPEVPWEDLKFATLSGKVEIYSQWMADQGLDPLPTYHPAVDHNDPEKFPEASGLTLVTGASHHFVTTSFGNSEKMLKHAGTPFLEIHPDDAAAHHIEDGDTLIVENSRGCIELRAVVTDKTRPGVVISPKGHWAKHNGGKNVNWLTPDAVGDLAGQSTYHTNKVWVRAVR